jgi:hypothetical protein
MLSLPPLQHRPAKTKSIFELKTYFFAILRTYTQFIQEQSRVGPDILPL